MGTAAGVWSSNGARSPSVRLAREARCSVGTARVEVARARQLRCHATTAAALAAGTLSLDHVPAARRGQATDSRRRVRARTRRCSSGSASTLTFENAQRAVDYWTQHVDAETVEAEAAEVLERNSLYAVTSFDGRVLLQGELDPVGGTIVQTELERLAAALHRDDKQAGITRTRSQRTGRSAGDDGGTLRRPTERREAGPRLFRVTIGDDSVARLCELGNGTVVSPGPTRPLPRPGRPGIDPLRRAVDRHLRVPPAHVHRRPARSDHRPRPALPAPLRLRRTRRPLRHRPPRPLPPRRANQPVQRRPRLPAAQPHPRAVAATPRRPGRRGRSPDSTSLPAVTAGTPPTFPR